MEKADFVRDAPEVYALAIAVYLNSRGGVVSKQAIEKSYTVPDKDDPDSNLVLVRNSLLWDAAIDWLVQKDMVVVSKPKFGPALYSSTPGFELRFGHLASGEGPFGHYALVGDKRDWLVAALYDVSDEFHALEITADDFKNSADEWQPIQLDRQLPSFEDAVTKLSLAVKEIRENNGYAASFPEERDFVVGGLEKVVEKLESGSISPGYLRDAWEKLKLAGKRFSGAGLGLVIIGAQQAIVDFVKQQGGELLRILSRMISGG